jgi:glycerol-3-phosphate acyltransferase PlsY
MIFLSIFLSYLIGAIPTAYMAGRILKNIDIRKHGSGNVGATNVFRVLGKGPGIIVLLIDIAKGIIPVAVVADCLQTTTLWERIVISLAAVAGHNWTVFLQFKGGKGIATSLGVLIGLTIRIASIRPVLLYTLLTWLVVFVVSGFVSLASIIAAVFLPLFMILTNQPFSMIFLGIVFCVFVVLRHRPNIRRLIAGEENRVPLPFHRNKKS